MECRNSVPRILTAVWTGRAKSRLIATELSVGTPCPLVVDYSALEQARALDELDALPERVMVVRMLSDCAVLRDQARACL